MTKKMKVITEEWWFVKCVDRFEKYHKNLKKNEKILLNDIRAKISDIETKEAEMGSLYLDAIYVLHDAFCRKYPNKKCVLRFDLTDEEEMDNPSTFCVTEVFKEISRG